MGLSLKEPNNSKYQERGSVGDRGLLGATGHWIGALQSILQPLFTITLLTLPEKGNFPSPCELGRGQEFMSSDGCSHKELEEYAPFLRDFF